MSLVNFSSCDMIIITVEYLVLKCQNFQETIFIWNQVKTYFHTCKNYGGITVLFKPFG